MSVVTVGRATYPLVLPNFRDPRLHVAAVIITVHVLGQVGLHFTVSVWQILAAILTCAALEVAITFQHKRAIVWPASAMLTGSGIGLILRVVGTPPDDHWSTYAIGVFAIVAGLALLSKYAIRYRGAPLFNPSNVALVGVFVLLGPSRVEPLDFWWAPPNAWLVAAYAVILTGGVLITRRLRLTSLAASFWLTLAAGLGLLAASGHCITANWAFAPVCGVDFWRVIVISPEVFIFLFFMITDPRTVPAGRVGRILFGSLVAVAGTLILATQTTEFGAKVGLLSGLVLLCGVRPIFDRIVPQANSVEDDPRRYFLDLSGLEPPRVDAPRLGFVLAGVSVVAVAIVIAGAPARDAAIVTPTSEEAIDPVRMDPATFPSITIDHSVTDWDPTLSGAAMQQIVLTAAQNLEVEDQALVQADPSLLARVDHGDRLIEMEDRVRDAAATGTTRIERYRPDSVAVRLIRPFGRQDGLSLGLEARGLMTTETYDAAGRLQARTTSPFNATFVVRRATGARWLNVAVLPAAAHASGVQLP
jgi:Na+-translocating ferredoxin:NAD+ oxidoreductase RnfD subunit